MNEVFRVLCFSEGHSVYYPQYSPIITKPIINDIEELTDIEELLDLVVKNSDLFRMPEEQPEFWPHYKENNLSEKDIDIINAYRRKFNKREI